MIREQDLMDAIAECQGERNPNANTCIKLAAYYTILENLRGPVTHSFAAEPTRQLNYDSGSDFSDAIKGKNMQDVLSVMDELMETVAALIPKLYRSTIEKLNDM